MARVLCAMSGGVDSSVSALLLQEAGHDVVGAFMRLGSPSGFGIPGTGRTCCGAGAAGDAAIVAGLLGIPFHRVDLEREFGLVVDDFVEEYHRGRTPNPCVRCNQWIKFGPLLDRAWSLDCDAIATGHYARVERGPDGGPRLRRGADGEKDQSYFLFAVGRPALEAAMFPVGGLTKAEVRAIARARRLPVAEKPESQEICFVPGDYRDALRARDPGRFRPGPLLDTGGRVIGEHPGHQNYTIGQRRGLGAHGSPRYVVAIDAGRNEVVLGCREDLAVRSIAVEGVTWCSIPPPGCGAVLEARVQIRYRHPAAPSAVTVEAPDRARVELREPEYGVTPGQAAVFYRDDLVLGGGWIGDRPRS